MKNKILFRTNVFVCIIIVLGFIITSITSYQSNIGVFEKDVEHVSNLSAEGIYYQIEMIFSKPVSVSLTMANDNLLKEFLLNEEKRMRDDAYIQSMRDYLDAYQKKYNYDSVFLVSTQTGRYYHFNGLDRILTPDNGENTWYYDFLQTPEEYSLNIDNDEAGNNEITIFINCKIKDQSGNLMGVVGVGFHVDYLQDLLKKYEDQFDVQTRLVNRFGRVEISTGHTGFEKVSLFDEEEYLSLKEVLLSNEIEPQMLWSTHASGKSYIVSRYIENLDWHLIVENDTSDLTAYFQRCLLRAILVILAIVLIVLFTITAVIRRYNAQIVALTAAHERKYYEIRQEAAKQLYENIYELDITHNCAATENTQRYFESLGIPPGTPFDESLKIIAAKQIKKEYRQGYLDTFSPRHVLEVYQKGIKSLTYDFMISNDGKNYYWMRIMACIYFWSGDSSVRMTTYRQNIDEEKRQERLLFAQIQSDPLTGLYNKAATEEMITETLALPDPNTKYGFFILDIDDFKKINDTLGHAAGDFVISQFGEKLKRQFREEDVVGRIGGDEFVVFLGFPDEQWLEQKAQKLLSALSDTIVTDAGECSVTASIGIAVYPKMGTDFASLYKNADLALYERKKHGKNGYTLYPKVES